MEHRKPAVTTQITKNTINIITANYVVGQMI